MKTFIIKISIFTGMLLLFFITLISIFIQIPKDTIGYMSAYEDKINILQNSSGKRIILVGGSNLAFGVDSELLERSTGRNVVNLGLHVGLGLKFMLDDIEDYLLTEDIVLIIPEYEHFNKQIFLGEIELTDLIWNMNIHGLKKVSPYQFKKFCIYSPKVIFYSFYRFIIANEKADDFSHPYRRDSFNKYGDVIGHLNMTNQNISINKLDIDHAEETIRYLNQYFNKPKIRNVKHYFIYPAYQEAAYKFNQNEIVKLDLKLKNNLDVEILGSVNDFVLDDNLFFDTYYHLNKKGTELRTKVLIDLLKDLPTK